jgi:hypothetical protein
MQNIQSAIDQYAINFAEYTRRHHAEQIESLYIRFTSGPSEKPIETHPHTTKTSCNHVFKRGNNIGKKCSTETKNSEFCSKHRLRQHHTELSKDEQYKYDLMQLLNDDEEVQLLSGMDSVVCNFGAPRTTMEDDQDNAEGQRRPSLAAVQDDIDDLDTEDLGDDEIEDLDVEEQDLNAYESDY